MASSKNGTLYVGSTSDLERRVWQHKNKAKPSLFTAKHSILMLVYYNQLASADDMVEEERRIKKWNRKWKLELIERDNPKWLDLSLDFNG